MIFCSRVIFLVNNLLWSHLFCRQKWINLIFDINMDELNIEFMEKLKKSINKHSEAQNYGLNCIEWQGCCDKDGYPIKSVTWPGCKRKLWRVAWLVLVIQRKGSLPEVDGDGQPLEVSHLCHNRTCIKPEHLTVEPHYTNTGRRQCVAAGRCLGHTIPCIFWCMLFLRWSLIV